MILEKEYLRERAVMYAEKYALQRNPLFYTFEGIGGNCTNFVSQCILAGSCTMNYTPIYGWYYLSTNRRSASWTGVEYFYNFMTANTDVGPFGREVDISLAEIGDAIQLQNADGQFYHTLIISKIENGEIYICANSNDALNRALSTYEYANLRVIHIEGVRYDTRFIIDCFDALFSPPSPPVPPPAPQTEETPPVTQEEGEAPSQPPVAEGEPAAPQGNANGATQPQNAQREMGAE